MIVGQILNIMGQLNRNSLTGELLVAQIKMSCRCSYSCISVRRRPRGLLGGGGDPDGLRAGKVRQRLGPGAARGGGGGRGAHLLVALTAFLGWLPRMDGIVLDYQLGVDNVVWGLSHLEVNILSVLQGHAEVAVRRAD